MVVRAAYNKRLVTSWIVSLIYGLAYGSSFARARDLVATHVEEGVDMEAVLEAWCLGDKLKVTDVYEDIQEHGDLVRWHRVVWASIDTPKHEFVLWLAVLGKLSIYDRLFYLNVDHVCRICDDDEVESLDHFFFRFPYLKYIWENVRARF